ncbi:MAG: benzoyl-CoA 2,3-epoxidase subunit BoxB [Myxococcales bacterium]|nr:benzoyl-CoA 2,3-epoxidase subunit BoxB [Myxococcales bacterium]
MNISSERIPNNVNLSDDKRLQRALEQWQPHFLNWWQEMGPDGFLAHEVYLRTAVSVDEGGWANYGYVRMPDYRWGIFLAPPVEDRRIGFGDNLGQPVWHEVPGEFRNALRRLIVTQGDTEPASVEQQRLLGRTCPSLYDLRNLFQVNVEEGRHLWAMVYLLQDYFGRDGREEAEELLERRSGQSDHPRLLEAFNQPIADWLSFFCFTMFTDRDGKYQLLALAESGFDALSRTTRFMLTEEAHHMFVGESGIERVVQRTVELMANNPDTDVRKLGGIDLLTVQKYVNMWYSASLDLFGGEISSNAAEYFAAGLKGRYKEDKYTDHVALDGTYAMPVVEEGRLIQQDVPLRNAMNEILRDAYARDSDRGVQRWNKHLEEAGFSVRIQLPNRRFNRHIGIYSGTRFDPDGNMLTQAEWDTQKNQWLPTADDLAYVRSLMKPVIEPGKMAGWIAAPRKGINGLPVDFEYVRTDG